MLEVTITHKLRELAEVMVLLNRQLIALDWERKGPDPGAYTGSAKSQVKLFHRMRTEGAAVVAAYNRAIKNRGDRLIGLVQPGAEFDLSVNGLLCLPLTNARVVSSSTNFLGNLPPRQCTVQPCHDRAKGRLAALVNGEELSRSVWTLHNLDVECLATNFLIVEGMCASVWSGGRSFADVDHVGYSLSGREVLAQTTVSETLVGEKATRLLELRADHRDLVLFGPEAGRGECVDGVRYISIEDVFSVLDAKPEGRWLIDRMIGVATASIQVQG
jgi:hypothetical protein